MRGKPPCREPGAGESPAGKRRALSLLSRGGEASSRPRSCPTLPGHQGARAVFAAGAIWVVPRYVVYSRPMERSVGRLFSSHSSHFWEDTMKELAKQYDPSQVEDRIYQFWQDGGYFHTEADPDKKPYTIVMPPPNVTGQLHMGHALDNTMQDVLIRTKRMQGYAALWVPGTDHASIATEAKVVEVAKHIKPSARGELEITTVNQEFLKDKNLKVQTMARGFAWLDTGTHDSLSEASTFIEVLEKRQGLKVACLEGIAYRQGWITAEQLRENAQPMLKNDYGKYLLSILEEKNQTLKKNLEF